MGTGFLRISAIVGLVVCLPGFRAWGQETPPPRETDGQQRAPAPEPSPILQSYGPWLSGYPLELLDLLAPPAERGPITVRPSIAISEEYNDNVFLNNQDRQWDLITNFSPALTLFVNRPSYRLSGGYTFTSQVYARETRLSNALSYQNFLLSGLYQGVRGLTFSVFDSFVLSRNTNLVASQGFATGRQESWSNTFGPGMTWQMTRRNSLSLGATYSVQRFVGAGTGQSSDTYGLQSNFSHVLTPRLTGFIGYGFTHLKLQEQENSTTHTPILGVSYRVTPTLSGSVSGGPAVTQVGAKTFVSPAVNANLTQVFRAGSVGVQYTRSVGVAGGFGGTTDIQTVSGTLVLPALRRGLIVLFSPAYSTAESLSRQQTGQVSAKTFTMNVAASYQIARFASVFAGYTFLRQRTGSSSSLQADADQDRVRFGVQFGYPINFD